MKKYLILTAMAVVLSAPSYAQDVTSTSIKQTDTAVERAAREQGFVHVGAAPAAASGTGEMPAPQVIDNTSVNMMAPQQPEAESAAAPAAAQSARPALIVDGLPRGLVIDGPGTEAYKKKHRRKKSKKTATEQVKPAEEKSVAEKPAAKVTAPEPTPELAPAEPEALPDANAMPPADEMPEPAPAPEAEPMSAPAPDTPVTAPAPEQHGALPEPALPDATPELEPAPLGTPAPQQDDNDPLGMPGLQPGVPHPAPSNPFAP